ncbi:MAG TPA: site-specific integrase [Castellaniella sp.]|jgi:site-specific recombinase XerD|nr:site-specific integrase [Castellaniella sp.]
MAHKIDTVTARAKLPLNREPHWHKLAKGCFVGFRRMSENTDGVWLARFWDEAAKKKRIKTLGALDEAPAHARFDLATKQAQDWFQHLGAGGDHKGIATVATACADYVTHLRSSEENRGAAADDAEGRFRRWVDNTPLARIELQRLRREHLRSFRARLADTPVGNGDKAHTRAPDSINRDMSALRAALNLAHKNGLVMSDFAWKVPLEPIKNASRRRTLYLDRTQRKKLLQHAAPDIERFMRGLCLLPLRPGAVAALTVQDLNTSLGTLRIGRDKSGAGRHIKLPKTFLKFCTPLTKNRAATAPLFARADGAQWNKDSWKGPLHEAAKAAGLPRAVSAYTLRHSAITDLVVSGLDLFTVAKLAGTSIAMIEKHYGHLQQDIAARALEKLTI